MYEITLTIFMSVVWTVPENYPISSKVIKSSTPEDLTRTHMPGAGPRVLGLNLGPRMLKPSLRLNPRICKMQILNVCLSRC